MEVGGLVESSAVFVGGRQTRLILESAGEKEAEDRIHAVDDLVAEAALHLEALDGRAAGARDADQADAGADRAGFGEDLGV